MPSNEGFSDNPFSAFASRRAAEPSAPTRSTQDNPRTRRRDEEDEEEQLTLHRSRVAFNFGDSPARGARGVPGSNSSQSSPPHQGKRRKGDNDLSSEPLFPPRRPSYPATGPLTPSSGFSFGPPDGPARAHAPPVASTSSFAFGGPPPPAYGSKTVSFSGTDVDIDSANTAAAVAAPPAPFAFSSAATSSDSVQVKKEAVEAPKDIPPHLPAATEVVGQEPSDRAKEKARQEPVAVAPAQAPVAPPESAALPAKPPTPIAIVPTAPVASTSAQPAPQSVFPPWTAAPAPIFPPLPSLTPAMTTFVDSLELPPDLRTTTTRIFVNEGIFRPSLLSGRGYDWLEKELGLKKGVALAVEAELRKPKGR